jgi:hypothetical protein
MMVGMRGLQGLWLKALLFALFGYALFGRGFAYLFLGEVILIIGFFIFLQSQRIMLIFSDGVLLLWALFAIWGFCRTVPFIGRYGFDALRDAVLWGYGTVALLIAAFVNKSSQISRALNTYRKFLHWYLPVAPGLVLATMIFKQYLPVLPWARSCTIIYVKAGDAAVQLAAAGVFLLLFPDQRRGSKAGLSLNRLIGFLGWSATALIILVVNRSGSLAIILSFAVVSLLKTHKVGWKVVALGVLGSVLTLAVLESGLVNVTVHGRAFTPDQIAQNIGSMGGGEAAGHQGTTAWRLVWWRNIIDYTVFGPYRWTGKGFGINLAVVDGPPGMTEEDSALRSPHNGNMTVLARMGVPGLVLWAALNFLFVYRLCRAYKRAIRSGSQFWSDVNLWIICFWLAAFVNMSFDVYLEGPQGGMWFWSIIGLGVAALRVQAHEARQASVQANRLATGALRRLGPRSAVG